MLRSDEYEMTSHHRQGRFQENWIWFLGCLNGRLAHGAPAARGWYWAGGWGGGFVFAITLALSIPASDPALGSTIRISPNLDISESYTDNVRGAREGAEADLITETRAGGQITANGNRLDLNLSLAAINERYLDTNGLNSTRPQILGIGNVEILEDHFFIDSSVSMSETSTRRGGAVSARNRSLPTNRTQILVYDVAPRYEQRIGRWLDGTLRYSHSESRYSRPSAGITGPAAPGLSPVRPIGNQKTDLYSLTLDTGDAFSQINSQLELSSKSSSRPGRGTTGLTTGGTTGAAASGKRKANHAELVNEYKVNRHVGLIARAGYEENKNPTRSFNNSGATGALGVHLTPGPRLDFRTEYGRRYNRSNLSASLNYQLFSFYTLNATFKQGVRTQQDNRLNRQNRLITGPSGDLIDPFTGTAIDPTASSFDLSNASFREDAFALGFSGTRGRNTVNFGVDVSSRDSGEKTPGISSKQERLAVNLDLSRRLQPRLTGNLALNYSDTLTSRLGALADTRYTGDAGLNYVLSETFTSRFEYTYFKRDFKAGGGSSENVVTLGLNAQF